MLSSVRYSTAYFPDGAESALAPAVGSILRSPNGTRYRLGVDDAGLLTTTSL
jgi:hypothetical protein